MKKPTIKQQILDHLKAGYTLTYGQANTITNSQSGYRRFQEILKENPDKYRFMRIKSDNGGYYNVFGLPKCFKIFHYGFIDYHAITYRSNGRYELHNNEGKGFKTQKEAKAHIKKVIR